MDADRLQVVRDCFRAYELGERSLIEPHLHPDFVFYSPPDPGIDLAAYWRRCWPNARAIARFEFTRLVALPGSDEVIATYVSTRRDGSRFRNTEVFAFEGDRVVRVEVYFGWDL